MGEIERIVEDVYPACALLAGTKLDLFTPMAERPRSGAELAEELVAVRGPSRAPMQRPLADPPSVALRCLRLARAGRSGRGPARGQAWG